MMKDLQGRMKTLSLGVLCAVMAVGLFLGAGIRSRAEVQTGEVGGTKGAITWSYDTKTKIVTVTGKGTRTWSYIGDYQPFPVDAKKVVFKDCKISGSMHQFFYRMKNLTAIDFTGLDIGVVTDMAEMFLGCSSLTSLDVSSFDTAAVTDMGNMFQGCGSLTSLDLSSFDTAAVTDMGNMFYGCSSLTKLDVSGFDTAAVTFMAAMFRGCSSLTKLDVSGFDTGAVDFMEAMFRGCRSLTSLNLSSFNTKAVRSMNGMFYDCSSLTNLDLRNFNTRAVKDMGAMFMNCSNLTSLNLSCFDTHAVQYMNAMFMGCSSLTSLDISSFDTRAVNSMWRMFFGCGSLTRLDLSNFDMAKVEQNYQFLSGCEGLKKLKAPTGLKNETYLFGMGVWTRSDNGEMVTAIPMELTKSVELTFSPRSLLDVKETGWEYPFVRYVVTNRLMNGKGKDAEGNITFDPNGNLTRAEFARVLYNMEYYPSVAFEECFLDVEAGKWYSDAIIWAKQSGIVAGKNGIFDVSGKITREEMATMLKKYAEYHGYYVGDFADLSSYEDVDKISSWAVENLRWAIGNNVMKGKGTKIDPSGKATRAECAAMLKNFCERYGR